MNRRVRDLLGVLVVLCGLHIMTAPGAVQFAERIADRGNPE